MYNGEVNVAQEDLDSFLPVAEDLKIKGLTQTPHSPVSQKTPTHKPASKRYEEEPVINRSERSNNTAVQRPIKNPRPTQSYGQQSSINQNISAPRRREVEEQPVIKTEAPTVYEDVAETNQIVAAETPLYQDNEIPEQYDQTYQDHDMEYTQGGAQAQGQFQDLSQGNRIAIIIYNYNL